MAQTIALQTQSPNVTQAFQTGRQNRLTNDLSQFKLEQSRELAPLKRRNKLLEGLVSKATIQESRATEQNQRRKTLRKRQERLEEERKEAAKGLLRTSQQLREIQDPQQRAQVLAQNREVIEPRLQTIDPNLTLDQVLQGGLTDDELLRFETAAQQFAAGPEKDQQKLKFKEVPVGDGQVQLTGINPETGEEVVKLGKPTAPEKEKGEGRAALIETEQGTRTVPVVEKASGQIVTQDGQQIDPQQFRGFVGKVERTEKGEPGDFTGKDVPKAVQDIQATATTVTNGLQTAQDIARILNENPQAFGNPGILGQFANEAVQTVIGAAPILGVSQDKVRELQDPNQFDATFREIGIDNARLKSAINNLAVAKVAAEQGRVSNTDVQKAIKEIGGSLSDPEAARQTLRDFSTRLARQVRNKVRVRPELAEDARAQRAVDVVQQELKTLNEILSGGQGQEQDLESKSTEKLFQMAQ